MQRLMVDYLIKGNLETDLREGYWFRSKVHDGGQLSVFQFDAKFHFIWSKTYFYPVSSEVTIVEVDMQNS